MTLPKRGSAETAACPPSRGEERPSPDHLRPRRLRQIFEGPRIILDRYPFGAPVDKPQQLTRRFRNIVNIDSRCS